MDMGFLCRGSFTASVTKSLGQTKPADKQGSTVVSEMEETAIALQAAYAQKIEELPINDWRFMAAARHIAKQLRTLPIGRLRWPGDMFPVQVAPSAVHGRGVFVTRDVQKGDLLTLYPNDALVSFRQGDNRVFVVPGKGGRSCAEVFEIHQQYGYVAFEHKGLLLQTVGFPELAEDPAYLGHMANDAVGPGRTKKTLKKTKATPHRKATQNATFAPINSVMHACLIATRPISKGSKVFVSYGADYWRQMGA